MAMIRTPLRLPLLVALAAFFASEPLMSVCGVRLIGDCTPYTAFALVAECCRLR